METFQALKKNSWFFITTEFPKDLNIIQTGDFFTKQQELSVEHDDSIYNNYYNNDTSYSNEPIKPFEFRGCLLKASSKFVKSILFNK